MVLKTPLRVFICILAIAGAVAAQQTAAPDVDRLGPQVGERVPEFSGTDQFGQVQSLASVMGEQGAMLVFFRSADW